MSEVLNEALSKVEARNRAKTDKMYLANEVMGYEFQECHRELFDLYPKFDETKSWSEQISGCMDIMLLWPRGHYKSTAIKVVITQAILNNPDITIIVQQGNLRLTQLFIEEIAKHFRGEAYNSTLRELFPEFCAKNDEITGKPMPTRKAMKMTLSGFTVCNRRRTQTPQATVTAASPKSIKTGQHYMLGVFDDLQNESNWRNPKQIAKVQEDFQGCEPLLQGAARWVSGTRWAHGDLYDQIMRWNTRSKWIINVKSCWSDDGKDVRFPKFKKKDGEPGGFSKDELLYLQEQDAAFFACQYLLQPVHSSHVTITKEQMWAANVLAQDAPRLSEALMVVDLASSEAEKADDSVITVGKVDSLGLSYLVDMRGDQWAPMSLAMNIIEMALRHRPAKILFEKTPSCVYFTDYLRLLARQHNVFLPIDYIRVNNQPDAKNIRVLGFAGVVKKGRFKFFAGLQKFDRLVEQITEFPKGRYGHDDYPDTCALLLQELTKDMLTLPMRAVHKDPILAMMHDRENALIKIMEQNEVQTEVSDSTGLD